MTLLSPAARQIRSALAAAPDRAVMRIVGLLDDIPHRGEADELLAGVRPRLRQLRPPKRLRLLRLLALPLEGALVAPAAWNASQAEIPRSALAPLGAAVTAALGPEAEEIEAACAGRSMADVQAVATLGGRLWRAAGTAHLPTIGPHWERAGLSPEAARTIIALAASLWRHGDALLAARRVTRDGPPETVLRATLGPILAEGPAAFTAATVLLLREAASPALVAWVAGGIAPQVVKLAEQALGHLLSAHAAAVAGAANIGDMADYAEALLGRVEDADAHDALLGREERRRHLLAVRRDAADACRGRYVEELQAELIAVTAQLIERPVRADDAAVNRLEATARQLRRLEAAGRRLGNPTAFDRARADVAPVLLALTARGSGLSRVDVARLIEIVAGTEAALHLVAGTAEA